MELLKQAAAIPSEMAGRVRAAVQNERKRPFQRYTARAGGGLALRAVVFDYGMVLTAEPDRKAYGELVRISGLEPAVLDRFYWADRHAYDAGALTGLEFWRKITRDAGLGLDEATLAELNLWDARMWTTQNPAMVRWQERLKERGLKTAILSNMGDCVHENIEREFAWLKQFDVLVWSYQLKMAKPEAAIYRCVLEKLGTQAGETLFVDDRPENVEAARAAGMLGVVFTDAAALRAELIAMALDGELPLPE